MQLCVSLKLIFIYSVTSGFYNCHNFKCVADIALPNRIKHKS